MVKQSEQVQKFYDVKFGELNIEVTESGEKMYCLMDICSILELLKREGDRIVKLSNCKTQQFFVKRVKQIVSRVFVDESGLISLCTESRKNKADKFRLWAVGLAGKLNRSIVASKRAKERQRGDNGKWVKQEPAVVKEVSPVVNTSVTEEDRHPTLEEYFKEFVPLDYLIPLLSATLKDYLSLSTKEPAEQQKKVQHRCSVLNTLNLVLIANKAKYPSRSYAKNSCQAK